MTISQQLKQQFAFLNNAATNTLSPSEMAELQKAYGVEQSKPRQLSERERAANLEAFNTRLTTEASEMGKAFITNTATLPAEARYRAWQQSQEAVKSRYAHLSEEQQQAALTAFNEHADVFRLADKEAGFFARTGDALSYIPTSLTKLGEQATGLIAPESEARKWFADATQEVESWRSDEAKMRALRASDAMAEAKKRGESGFSQFFANAKDNPLEAVGQFTESALPTIGAAVAGAAAAPFTGGASLALPFVVGGVQGAGETRNEIYDHIMAMPQAQLSQSPEYQALLAKGLSEQKARQALASSITEHGGEVLATGLSSAALSQLGGLGRIGQVGKGVMGSTAGKFASEVITEPVDEVFQQWIGNKAINDIDPTHSLTEGLGEAAAGGLLFGAAGGAMAAADNAYRKSKSAPAQPESDKTIDELTQATPAQTQPTQSQPQATVNEKVLENVLADYKAQTEEAAYNEMYEELKADIAEGNIHARAADDNGDTQYRDFARAYLAQTGQTAPPTQAAETEQDVTNKRMYKIEPTVDSEQQNIGNLRHSLNESVDSDFVKAVDRSNGGYKGSSKRFVQMGTTPDVLKMIGLPDTRISIREDVIDKVIRNKHFINAEDFKRLPQQINNPIAVMRSRTRDNGFVVLTELTEQVDHQNKPVIAALHLKTVGNNGLEVIDIASAYGRNISQLNEDIKNTLYWNKAKGYPFANRAGLQLPNVILSEDNLSGSNIKTEMDLSQYQHSNNFNGDKFEENGNAAFELKPTGEQVGSNDPNLPTQTLPTRQRQGMGAVGTDNVQQTAPQRNSQVQADQQALSRILGEEIASHIEVVDRNTVKPPKGQTIESLKNVEGWYDRSTQKAYIYSDGITEAFGLTREERLAWVAWHELAHKGLNVKYGNTLKSALQQARKHPVVGVISNRIQQRNPSYSEEVAIEEALVELYSAYQTGNWESLNQRYQTRINPGYALKGKYDMGNVFQRFAAVIKRLIAALSKNKRAAMMSEQALFDLIKKVDNSVMDLGSSKPSQDTQAESDVRYSFAGQNARNADTRQMGRAMARLQDEDNSETVRQETGWFKGADGRMRFEIMDNPELITPYDVYEDFLIENEFTEREFHTTLGAVWKDEALFESYPHLRHAKVVIKPFNTESSAQGYFNPKSNEIVLSADLNSYQMRDVLAHEVQHRIQSMEGFLNGNSPDLELSRMDDAIFTGNPNVDRQLSELQQELTQTTDPKRQEAIQDEIDSYRKMVADNRYQRSMGEVEARNVATRLNLTAEERRNRSPESTEDIKRENQISRDALGNTVFSLNENADSEFAKAVDTVANGEMSMAMSMLAQHQMC